MTRKEIRTMVRSKIGEPIAKYFQNLELDAWINDSGRDIAFRTKCLKDTDLMTTVENQAEYTISTAIDDDILSIYDVYLYRDGSRWDKLESTTRDELDILQDGWQSQDASTPVKYWYDKQLDTLGLYPKPNSDNSGVGYVKVYVNQEFTALTVDTATPSLPVQLHLAIVDFVSGVALDSRSDKNADYSKSSSVWQQYYARIQQYLSESRREKTDEEVIIKSYRNI